MNEERTLAPGESMTERGGPAPTGGRLLITSSDGILFDLLVTEFRVWNKARCDGATPVVSLIAEPDLTAVPPDAPYAITLKNNGPREKRVRVHFVEG